VLDTRGARFEDFLPESELLDGLYNMKWDVMSRVQAEAIPKILEGNDVVIRSLNGTGKTGSFLVPLLDMIDVDGPNFQALVVLPTHILSNQTFNVAKMMGKNVEGLGMMVVRSPEECTIREVMSDVKQDMHVVFSCPGRLLAMYREDSHLFDNLKMLVFDEADELFGQNFLEQSKQLLDIIPKKCQRVFASATFPMAMVDIIGTYMTEPVFVDPYRIRDIAPSEKSASGPASAPVVIPLPEGLTQFYIGIEDKYKIKAIRLLFSRLVVTKCVIFCSSVRRVMKVKEILDRWKYPCVCFFRNKEDKEFEKNLELFRQKKEIKYLITTDIAARGIDIPAVNVVIHFDFTSSPYTCLHRAGRAVRFGQVGLSILFVTPEQTEEFQRVNSYFGNKIERYHDDIPFSLYT